MKLKKKTPSIPWIMVTLMQLSQLQNMVEVTVSFVVDWARCLGHIIKLAEQMAIRASLL